MNKNIKNLVKSWQSSGINDGDMVLLHSSLSRTFKIEQAKGGAFSLDDILDSFIEAIGENGTLILPLFNFEFTDGKLFDIQNSPSQMGKLTEMGRKMSGAIRTGHPIYSFVAIGKKAKLFQNVDNQSGYGADSPFAIIHKENGKIAILNLPDQNSMTFYHYVEEMHNVNYRYHKKFKGLYTDIDGHTTERVYSLFVRDFQKRVETWVDPMGDYLWSMGLYKGSKFNEGNGLRTIYSNDLYNATSHIIKTDKYENMLMRFGR